MPPHCDSMDGPVVKAARAALVAGDVDIVLPYVHAEGETELRDAFDLASKVRGGGGKAADLADRWFFETAVRVHRAGEGAPFTGLKPAGLEVGPVIPAAERALASGSSMELVELMCSALRHEVETRLGMAMTLKARAPAGVAESRSYVDAALGLQVWAHAVHRQMIAAPHQHLGGHEHD